MTHSKTYTAINIGPIIATLSIAKRPRELWSASYMFSHLMRCIIDSLIENGITSNNIISPALLSDIENPDDTVGLYPDRLFIQGEVDIQNIRKGALNKFEKDLGNSRKRFAEDYFNIMATFTNASSDNEAIQKLNTQLDYLELCNRTVNEIAASRVLAFIKKRKESPLFNLAFKSDKFPIKTLAEIACASLISSVPQDTTQQLKDKDDDGDNDNEDRIFNQFKDKLKSHHKYICVVQADGDRMGTVISNVKKVDGIKEISQELMKFGSKASESIRKFGGLPIYAGGDDLMFIAPVIGRSGHILDLIKVLDEAYISIVQKKVNDLQLNIKDIPVETSMSYGISISYYKYPLYEALETARHLLFDVAKTDRNAIAWKLQKNSGKTFDGMVIKNMEPTEIFHNFNNLIDKTCEKDSNLVTAISHKINANQNLLSLCIGEKNQEKNMRILSFFKKYLDYDEETPDNYIKAVKSLTEAFDNKTKINNSNKDIQYKFKKEATRTMVKNLYGMLRTAKFIKGEELNNE